PISQAIAAWPPLALLLTIELISRVPVHHRGLAVARLAATTIIAGIAAWVSYWHMVGVAARYGESGASPYLLPLSVDGLIIVASVCLVELAGRIRRLEAEGTPPAGVPAVGAASANGKALAPARAATANGKAAANGKAVTNGRATTNGKAGGPASRSPRKQATAAQRKPRTSRPRRPAVETAALAAAIEAE